jgi:copper homeostasis protein (lipoprotein)
MEAPTEIAMTVSFPRRGAVALALAALLVLAGCGREDAGDARLPGPDGELAGTPAGTDADEDAAAFERTWLGVLPCADCDGIQTRLQLLSGPGGARYVLEETYLGGPGDNRFVQEGAWREEATAINGEPAEVYRLDPDGPGRWFWVQPDGALEMLEAEGRPAPDGLAYRLQRL